MIAVGGNTWKLTSGNTQMTRVPAAAHQAGTLAEGGRECIEDIYGWVKPLNQSFITASRSIQFISFLFKYGKDCPRRIAACYLSSEWVGSYVFAGLLLIRFQSPFENWLEIWRA